jgi:hypothetical protein
MVISRDEFEPPAPHSAIADLLLITDLNRDCSPKRRACLSFSICVAKKLRKRLAASVPDAATSSPRQAIAALEICLESDRLT